MSNSEVKKAKRVAAIDFLRGIAILLVLFRHYRSTDLMYRISWTGVDLFFVLSGFLVSGLIFSEYRRYGRVRFGRFLLRRGFKIYPAFYIMIGTTWLYSELAHFPWIQVGVYKPNIMAELLFVQNYFSPIWYHTWSLAVEEHFYLLLPVLLFAAIRFCWLHRPRLFTAILLFTMAAELALRIVGQYRDTLDVTLTHVHTDGLLFGVLLSYLYHFRYAAVAHFIHKYSLVLWAAVVLCLLPAFLLDGKHPFMRTVGISLLFLGFGALMMQFILNERVENSLLKFPGRVFYRTIAFIGVYSYGIYLWHMFVRHFLDLRHGEQPVYLFPVYFFGSLAAGILLSIAIEWPFIRLRDRIIPSPAKSLSGNTHEQSPQADE